MKSLARFLVVLLTPFVFVFGGAGLLVLGLDHQSSFLAWTGTIDLAAGLLWCLGLWLLADSGSFRD